MKLEFTFLSIKPTDDIFKGEKFEQLKRSLLSIMVRQKDMLFKKGQDPDGNAWQPLKPLSESRKQSKNTSKKKKVSSQILVDTGLLKNSIAQLGAQDSVQRIDGNDIILGTNVEYAAIHNFGGIIERKSSLQIKDAPTIKIEIPARPFIGIGNEDEEKLTEKIMSFIDKNGAA